MVRIPPLLDWQRRQRYGESTRQARQRRDDAGLRRLRSLVLRLLEDLARLGYGERPALEYVAPSIAEAIRDGYAAFARSGQLVEADFGETCPVTAAWPDADGEPVHVEIDVDDRSVARGQDGVPLSLARGHWRLVLDVDRRCERILALRIEDAA